MAALADASLSPCGRCVGHENRNELTPGDVDALGAPARRSTALTANPGRLSECAAAPCGQR